MTDSPFQPDIESVLHSADSVVPRAVVALDPLRIGELASQRLRRRRVATGTVGVCCLLAAGYLAIRVSSQQESIATRQEPTAAQLLAELDRLDRQFDSAMATAEQALASSDIPARASGPSLVERLQQQTRLARLQQEVASLEAEAPLTPTDDWQLAWLRAGTKRLALARLDAELNPDVAAESYRNLAASYAGSPISEAALRALRELPAP